MRFGFAYDSAYPWFNGGIEKRRYLIMRALHEAGHEVHLFTMFREGMPGMEFVHKGIHYHCCAKAIPSHEMYTNGRRNMKWPLKYASVLPAVIWNYRFDLVDADAFPFLHIPNLAAYSRLTGANFVVTWHEVWDRKYWERYLPRLGLLGYVAERISARASRQMIANSSATKEGLVGILGVPAGRVELLPAAISHREIARYRSRRRSGGPDKFVCVGRLVPEKRVDIAIRAVAGTSARLTVIGSGPEKQRLIALAKKLGTAGRVRFVERMTEQAIMKEIAQSRALLMFSAREGMSVISIEALAIGTPVVITADTSLPWEIRKHCVQILGKDVGKELSRLLSSKKSSLYRPVASRREILKRFSAEEGVRLYERLAR